jgi:hypothetical protein
MSNVEFRMEEFYRFNIHEQLQKNLIPQRPRFTGGYGSDRRHSANRAFILTDTAADAGLQVYVWQLNLDGFNKPLKVKFDSYLIGFFQT